MKSIFAALCLAAVSASENESLFDNSAIYDNDFEAYRELHSASDNDCKIYESKNFYGAQQCKFSWECRGARSCERGGFCSGWDACVETPFPMQAPGILPDH